MARTSRVVIKNPFKVEGQWYWGQHVEVNGKKISWPVVFGPYITRKDAARDRSKRIRELKKIP